MTQAFNWQFKLMINRFNFKVAFTAMMFISVASTVYNVLKYHNIDRTSGIDSSFAYIFNQSNELLPLIIIFMPVIAVLPFFNDTYFQSEFTFFAFVFFTIWYK